MKRTRKQILAIFLPLLLLLACAALFLLRGEKPFARLQGEELRSVSVTLEPPDETLELTKQEIGELVPLLRELRIYRRDDSYRDYNGQAVTFTLTKTDGSKTTVMEYNPFLVIDGAGYRTEYAPCEGLGRFGNRLLEDHR